MVMVVGKVALAQAVEEHEGRHVAADGLGLEAGERAQEAVDVARAAGCDPGPGQIVDAFQEMFVRIAVPTGAEPRVELAPCFLVFFGVQVVGLVDEELAGLFGFVYKI